MLGQLSLCTLMWVWVWLYLRGCLFPIPLGVFNFLWMDNFCRPGAIPGLKVKHIYLYSPFFTIWWYWLSLHSPPVTYQSCTTANTEKITRNTNQVSWRSFVAIIHQFPRFILFHRFLWQFFRTPKLSPWIRYSLRNHGVPNLILLSVQLGYIHDC